MSTTLYQMQKWIWQTSLNCKSDKVSSFLPRQIFGILSKMCQQQDHVSHWNDTLNSPNNPKASWNNLAFYKHKRVFISGCWKTYYVPLYAGKENKVS
jgi:hypothetical protein